MHRYSTTHNIDALQRRTACTVVWYAIPQDYTPCAAPLWPTSSARLASQQASKTNTQHTRHSLPSQVSSPFSRTRAPPTPEHKPLNTIPHFFAAHSIFKATPPPALKPRPASTHSQSRRVLQPLVPLLMPQYCHSDELLAHHQRLLHTQSSRDRSRTARVQARSDIKITATVDPARAYGIPMCSTHYGAPPPPTKT